MGRRGVLVSDEAKWVFNRLASSYRLRPAYPDGLVVRLFALAGGTGRCAADLGAGTGHLAVPLARRGLRVFAVEPARAMLDEMGEAEGLEKVHATAEQSTRPEGRCDLVFLADAVHWVDPEQCGKECARLLRPDGVCAVVEAQLASTPFLDALFALLTSSNPKALRRAPEGTTQILRLATGTGRQASEEWTQEVLLEGPTLDGVLSSLSYVGPALGPEGLARLLEKARELASAHGGAIWKRTLTLRWSRRGLGISSIKV